MRRQKEKKDYWNKSKNFSPDSGFEELDGNKFSPDELNSNREKEVIKDSKRGKDICEGLEDEERVQLEIKECTFKPK